MNFLAYTLWSLPITIGIEFLIYMGLIKQRKLKLLLYCSLINLFTWPLANLFVETISSFLIGSLVFVCETILIFYLFDIKLKKSLLISLVANLITFIVGSIILFFFYYGS
jgi:hypothetical protein